MTRLTQRGDRSFTVIPEFNQLQVTMADTTLLGAAGLTLDDVNGSDWNAVIDANEKLAVADGGVQ